MEQHGAETQRAFFQGDVEMVTTMREGHVKISPVALCMMQWMAMLPLRPVREAAAMCRSSWRSGSTSAASMTETRHSTTRYEDILLHNEEVMLHSGVTSIHYHAM